LWGSSKRNFDALARAYEKRPLTRVRRATAPCHSPAPAPTFPPEAAEQDKADDVETHCLLNELLDRAGAIEAKLDDRLH